MLMSYSNYVFLWYFDHHFCFVSSVKELDIKSHLEKKLQYVEEEKHRLECRLKNTELELKETQTSLEQSIVKRRVSKRLAVFFRYEWNFISVQNLGNEPPPLGYKFFDSPGIYLNSSIIQLRIKSNVTFSKDWTNFRPVENFRIGPFIQYIFVQFTEL